MNWGQRMNEETKERIKYLIGRMEKIAVTEGRGSEIGQALSIECGNEFYEAWKRGEFTPTTIAHHLPSVVPIGYKRIKLDSL